MSVRFYQDEQYAMLWHVFVGVGFQTRGVS
jgi:hypothetical protein